MASKTEVLDIIKRVVENEGYDFIDAECALKGKNPFIRVYADRVGGITIEDCIDLSRRIGDYFDREDVIEENYRLEVSSPGIDRPLKTERDFKRNIGRDVLLRVRGENGTEELNGEIRSTESALVLLDKHGQEVTVQYDVIVQGKLRIKW